jgi:hypothetical protein
MEKSVFAVEITAFHRGNRGLLRAPKALFAALARLRGAPHTYEPETSPWFGFITRTKHPDHRSARARAADVSG